MGETAWTHLGIVATVLVPIFMVWLDLRANNRKNSERLTRIETMLEPLWKWWNKNGT